MKYKSKLIALLSRSVDIRATFIDNDDGLASSRRCVFSGSLCGTAFTNLSGGVFMTSLILHMLDGSDSTYQNDFLGIFSMLGLAVGMFQILSPIIMERFPRRKKLLLIFRSIYHVMNLLLLGVVPILPVSLTIKTGLFLGIYVISSLIVQLSSAAFSTWHISDIPTTVRTQYFALCNMISPIISSLFAITASLFIDTAKEGGWEYTGLMLLRILACVFAALELYSFSKVEEPSYPPSPKMNPLQMLVLPFRTPSYLIIVLMTSVYAFGSNFVGSYFQAYLLDDVGLPYTLINSMGLFSIPINLLIYPFWTRLINRIGWNKVLFLSTSLYLTPYLLNAFTSPQLWWLYIPSCLTAYLFAPGITLLFANLPYTNIPKSNQTCYLAFYQTMNYLFAFIGSTISRSFVNFIGSEPICFLGLSFSVRAFINFIPCIFLLLTGLFSMSIYFHQHNKKAKFTI